MYIGQRTAAFLEQCFRNGHVAQQVFLKTYLQVFPFLKQQLVLVFNNRWQKEWQKKKKVLRQDFKIQAQPAFASFLQTAFKDFAYSYYRSLKRELENFESNFLGSLSVNLKRSMLRLPTEPMPEGTKFVFQYYDTTVVIVEEEPQVRSLWFSPGFLGNNNPGEKINGLKDGSPGNENFLSLSFPYVIFVLFFNRTHQLRKMCLFYSKEPLENLNQRVFKPNLPNYYTDGVCRSNSNLPENAGLFRRTSILIADFWQSRFSSDGNEYYLNMEEKNPELNIWNWAEHTQQDPNFGLKVKWCSCSRTLKNFIIRTVVQNYSVQDSEIYQLVARVFKEEFRKATADFNAHYPNTQALKTISTEMSKKMFSLLVEPLVLNTSLDLSHFDEILAEKLQLFSLNGLDNQSILEIITQSYPQNKPGQLTLELTNAPQN